MVLRLRKRSNAEIEEIAKWMLENNATLRQAETHFRISKSTVHKYCRIDLPKFNAKLATEVGNLLDRNREAGPIRGGEATKEKYLSMKRRQKS